jgi:hypothetical protein
VTEYAVEYLLLVAELGYYTTRNVIRQRHVYRILVSVQYCAQDGYRWRALVNSVMNLRVP